MLIMVSDILQNNIKIAESQEKVNPGGAIYLLLGNHMLPLMADTYWRRSAEIINTILVIHLLPISS